MPTDRRARLHCEDCGVELDEATAERNMLACWTYCDACLERLLRPLAEGWVVLHPHLTPADIGRGQASWRRYQEQQRAEKRARRLAIERQRRRIADHPRAGDRLWLTPGDVCTQVVVTGVLAVSVQVDERDEAGNWWHSSFSRWALGLPLEWPQLVRRARLTQEGPA